MQNGFVTLPSVAKKTAFLNQIITIKARICSHIQMLLCRQFYVCLVCAPRVVSDMAPTGEAHFLGNLHGYMYPGSTSSRPAI